MDEQVPPRTFGETCDALIPGEGYTHYPCKLRKGHMSIEDPDPEPHYITESFRARRSWNEWWQRQQKREASGGDVTVEELTREEEEGIRERALAKDPDDPFWRKDQGQPGEALSAATAASRGGLPGSTEDLLGNFIGGYEVREPVVSTEVLRQRPGDQPLPVPNDQPSVQDAVIADIEERKQLGLQRYGTLLQPHNGRDALLDAYQEALDLAVYLKQALIERDGA